VIETKREALACHVSQKEWLDKTQGMDAYLDTMTGFARTLGEESSASAHAEDFTRHLSLGLSSDNYHPIEDILKELIYFR